MNEFEKLILSNLNDIKNGLNEVKNKINNLDNKMNMLDTKVNTVMTQTAKNAELKVNFDGTKDETEKLKFEIELIKNYIRN